MQSTATDPDGHEVQRTVEGFWVDADTARGSSGSPIFLKPERLLALQAAPQAVKSAPFLLGVLAGNEFGELDGRRVDVGLAIAFNSIAIQETLDLF
jgi:hypothetical protein